jgi:Undecaprenyl-phosphate glucose phosphotransferase
MGRRRSGLFDVRTAIFGGGAQASELLKHLTDDVKLTLKLIGRYDDRVDGERNDFDLPPSRGGLSDLLREIRIGNVDQVIVALPWAFEKRVQMIVQQLSLTPVRIRLAPDLVGYAYRAKPFALLGDIPVITVFDRPISGLDQSAKWIEDQVLAWLLLFLLAPVFLVVALAIRLESPGPVFFRQVREGFNDRQFRIWKFRSMHHSASELTDVVQAQEGDSRVTRVGAFLRRSSLDELPQLFNVITGEMSIVGPRPHAPSTRAGHRLFREAVSNYASRHRVKPGITGWAQVCGWRGPTDTEDKLVSRLEHDLYYIENWSVWFDIWILVRTCIAAASRKNAF